MWANFSEVGRSRFVVWTSTGLSFPLCAICVYVIAPGRTGQQLGRAWEQMGPGAVQLSSAVMIVWIAWAVGAGALVSLYTSYRSATRVWKKWRRVVQVIAPAGLVSLVTPVAWAPIDFGTYANTEEMTYAANTGLIAPVFIATIAGVALCAAAALIWPLAAWRRTE